MIRQEYAESQVCRGGRGAEGYCQGDQGGDISKGIIQLVHCSRTVHKVKVRKVSFGFCNWKAREAIGDFARTDSGK